MLATFNLQLSTLDLNAETRALQGIEPIDGQSEPAGFAALLQIGITDTATLDGVAGDALPPTGNTLPEPDIAITLDGVELDAGGDAEIPVPPVADEQPWESLATPPGLELSQPIADAGAPAQGAIQIGINALTPQAANPATGDETRVAPAEPSETAALKPRPAPIPLGPADVPRELIADERGTRVVPGVQFVVPREVQPRNGTPIEVQQNLVAEDGQPVLQDTAARATTVPLQQAAPAVEQLADPARPVVQPGIAQPTVSAQAFQPGAFASLAQAAPPADGTFSSALQQQVTDLIETPVREANWGDRIGERLVMMANNQLKTAEIRLTPAELGPVRVQVNVEDGAANITFQAQHAMTREAIEQALPRLREMFAESGLSLGQTSVGEQNVAGNRDGNARGEARSTGQGNELLAADDETPTDERLTRRHEGLLDTFV